MHTMANFLEPNWTDVFVWLAMGDFAYSGIHVKPDDAVSEIDHLVDVFDGMASIWGSSVKLNTQSRFHILHNMTMYNS